MRYAFIVNPISGTGKKNKEVIAAAENLIRDHMDEDIIICPTNAYENGAKIADTLASEALKAGEDVVVFACGGDGTAHEIANGIYGYDNAILGMVPIGTGNDLCRALGKGKVHFTEYLDLEKQLKGRAKEIDVIEINGCLAAREKSCICVNGVNIGFDGNTAVRATHIHEKTIFKGSLAYLAAVFVTLVEKDGQSLRITADGKPFYDGELLLATMSNGNYCGGGIESCPNAVLDDGLIELLAIKDMSRLSLSVAKAPEIKAEAAAIYSLDLDRHVYEKNGDEKIDPYSITKILTCYLALEKLDPERYVTIKKSNSNSTMWTERI